MKLKPMLLPLALIAAAVATAFVQAQQVQTGGSRNATAGAAPAGGGGVANLRIAVASPSRIFVAMRETVELKKSMTAEGVRLKAEEDERRAKVLNLQGRRNELKADTPQWDEANEALLAAATELDTWGKITKAKAERNQKRRMKHLFEQIEAAVTEVAEREGYDLIVADQRAEIPNLDEINFNQLQGLINSRTVLYASAKADISDQVIALLDAKYKGAAGAPAGGGSGAAAPAAPGRRPAEAAPPRQGGGAGAPQGGAGDGQ
jgi:Skp family chaperone for outer membrane proteins